MVSKIIWFCRILCFFRRHFRLYLDPDPIFRKLKISQPTGMIAFQDGSTLSGIGFGAERVAIGELCFNTAMTGYQEILSDPSYYKQIVLFTFPHIGINGTCPESDESQGLSATGMISREIPNLSQHWNSKNSLDSWLKQRNMVGIAGIDTRALTRKIRDTGLPHVAISYHSAGKFSPESLIQKARDFAGIQSKISQEKIPNLKPKIHGTSRIAILDYGSKQNIADSLKQINLEPIVLPGSLSAAEICAIEPDGILLSNGPGDPAEIAERATQTILELLENKIPIFGICLGHQLLAIALGARTVKMHHGHHGANHPVRNLQTGQISITSMNHGFAVDRENLPRDIQETHISLFDGSNCGIKSRKYPAFSVQFHPEASPGPQDNLGLFEKFKEMIEK